MYSIRTLPEWGKKLLWFILRSTCMNMTSYRISSSTMADITARESNIKNHCGNELTASKKSRVMKCCSLIILSPKDLRSFIERGWEEWDCKRIYMVELQDKERHSSSERGEEPTLLEIHRETSANNCKLLSVIGCRSQFPELLLLVNLFKQSAAFNPTVQVGVKKPLTRIVKKFSSIWLDN